MIANVAPSQQAVLGLLGKQLFGQEYDLPENTDAWALIQECRSQAVTAIALSGLKFRDDPHFARVVYSAVLNNNRVLNDHSELHKLLTENGVPCVILKGAASAAYYPDPILRTMGDVDFLIKPEDMDKVRTLLLAEGFTMQGENHGFHRAFKKGKTHLEAHFAFAEKINPEIDRYVDEYLSSIIESAECVSSKNCTCMLPDRFHHGLILLLHMQRHMLTEGLGLRHLCDWAVFVNSFKAEEFSELFRERLEKIGLWTYAQILSLSAHIGLGLPYAPFMGDTFSVAEDLLRDILKSGNFGRNDHGRTEQRFFLENTPPDGKSNRVKSFVHKVNETITAHWPKAEKHTLLLLFGWVYFAFRRVLLRLAGKRRPLELAKSYKKSSSRRELYEKLHLFEV